MDVGNVINKMNSNIQYYNMWMDNFLVTFLNMLIKYALACTLIMEKIYYNKNIKIEVGKLCILFLGECLIYY